MSAINPSDSSVRSVLGIDCRRRRVLQGQLEQSGENWSCQSDGEGGPIALGEQDKRVLGLPFSATGPQNNGS
jgi:hypothetical protein